MEIFTYPFMQKAFLVGILLALIIPCIGQVMVLRRLSMIGDALSHSALAGVSAGLLMGINPVAGAIAACVIAALGIEAIRRRLPRQAELTIAVVMSAGIGIAGLLSGFIKNSVSFSSFLFGSIVAISDLETLLVVIVSAAVLITFVLFYNALFFITLDEHSARLSGVLVSAINFVFTILTAVTVSVSSRTVGALIVSSLMVIPVACGLKIGRSFKSTLLWSIGFSLFFMLSGLFLSYYLGLRPGGTIVLTGILTLVVILFATSFGRHGRKGA